MARRHVPIIGRSGQAMARSLITGEDIHPHIQSRIDRVKNKNKTKISSDPVSTLLHNCDPATQSLKSD